MRTAGSAVESADELGDQALEREDLLLRRRSRAQVPNRLFVVLGLRARDEPVRAAKRAVGFEAPPNALLAHVRRSCGHSGSGRAKQYVIGGADRPFALVQGDEKMTQPLSGRGD